MANIRKSLGLTQQQVADKLGTTKTTIYRIEKGDMGVEAWLEKFQEVYGCSISQIFGEEGAPQRDPAPPQLPYVGDVNGGAPLEIEGTLTALRERNQTDEAVHAPLVTVPFHVKGGYVLRVVGDSMNLIIPDGHFVVVDPRVPPLKELHGKVVILRVADGYTCKKINLPLEQAEPCSSEKSYCNISLKRYDVSVIGVVRQAFLNL